MTEGSHILLDTCILNGLLSKEAGLAQETKKIFNMLSENDNTFYISEFTRYELLRSAPSSKKSVCENLLDELILIKNSPERLNRAVYLYSQYKNHKQVKNRLHSISDVDVFIGSLIFTDQKPCLLTADYQDFPRPFFREKDIFRLEFNKKGSQKSCIYYYLLEANLDEFI